MGEFDNIEDDIEDKDDQTSAADQTADIDSNDDQNDDDFEVVIEGDDQSNKTTNDQQKVHSDEDRLRNRKKKKFRSNRDYRRLENQIADMKRVQDQIFGKLEGVNNTVSKVTAEGVDNRIAEAQSYLNRAKHAHKEAVDAGDGERAQQALDLMFDARDALNELKNSKSSVSREREVEKTATRVEPPRVDPRVTSNFEDFREEFDWYDPQVRDTDSRIAFALDNVLVAEGYDPRTKEYWDELKTRVRAHPKLQHHFESDDDMEDEQPRKSADQMRKKPTPPTGGRASQNSPAGKKRIVVSRERAQAMREMGLQPGTKEWNQMATKYASYDKQSA